MKRIIILLLALLLIGTIVYAGGRGQGSTGDTRIRIMTRWAGDAPEARFFRQRLTEWNSQGNGITIVDESLSDESAYLERLRTSMAAGNQPEIFIEYGGSRIQDYVNAGVLLNLQPYLDADPAWRDSFLSGIFDNWIFPGRPGVYGVPCQFYAIFLFYNKSMLRELGFNNPPATFDE